MRYETCNSLSQGPLQVSLQVSKPLKPALGGPHPLLQVSADRLRLSQFVETCTRGSEGFAAANIMVRDSVQKFVSAFEHNKNHNSGWRSPFETLTSAFSVFVVKLMVSRNGLE